MNVESREYKLLVDHKPFAEPAEALRAIWNEIEEAVNTLETVRTKGKFDESERRNIVFLDTADRTLRRHGLVLRRRAGDDAVEYTLKCRSEDRSFVVGTDVGAAQELNGKAKLEEDIAPPFRCRHSHSATIRLVADRATARAPTTLGEASDFFPILGTLRTDGRPCAPETGLAAVNHITVDESVWSGAKLVFDRNDDADAEKATVALILWSRGKHGRPVMAELSFRMKEGEERFGRGLAIAARSAYTLLQRLECSRPEGTTKTDYIYQDGSHD
jgi:hypothetical protein